jgi:hypothetical protein
LVTAITTIQMIDYSISGQCIILQVQYSLFSMWVLNLPLVLVFYDLWFILLQDIVRTCLQYVHV